MLNRLLSNLLISKYNRRRDKRLSQTAALPPASDEVPPDYTILGHVLSLPDDEIRDPLITRLSDQGIVALSPQARRRHVYILGATGTGKTNLLLRLIESDIKSRRAFCVIDLRGDLVDRILLRLAHSAPPPDWRERLLLMDLRDTKHAVGFNPLASDALISIDETVRDEELYGRVLHLLAVLEQQSGSWGVQLEETLRNCLIALAQSGWTLLEVEPLLTNAAFRAEVLEQVRDARVRNFFLRFGEQAKANQATQIAPVLNKLTPLLAVPSLRRMFGQKQSVSFRHLIDRQPGMVVLVALGVDRLYNAAKLAGGLLLSSFQTAIMSRSDQPENQRVPVHLYVDEFENIASERFQEIVAEGRRFGLGLTLSHQNISQLAPDMRHALRNNIHTQVYFQTGAQDAAELAKEIGGSGRDAIRQQLISQATGQAFLVRRSQPSTHIQVLHCPDPQIAGDKVRELRSASAGTYATPVATVEAELTARDQALSPAPVVQATPGSSARATMNGSTPAATYEIRHSKTTTFGPKPRKTAADTDEAADTTTAPEKTEATKKKTASPEPDDVAATPAKKAPVRTAKIKPSASKKADTVKVEAAKVKDLNKQASPLKKPTTRTLKAKTAKTKDTKAADDNE
jgi:hypothetical protein